MKRANENKSGKSARQQSVAVRGMGSQLVWEKQEERERRYRQLRCFKSRRIKGRSEKVSAARIKRK